MESNQTLLGRLTRGVGVTGIFVLMVLAYLERERLLEWVRPAAPEVAAPAAVASLDPERASVLRIDPSTVASLGIDREQAEAVQQPLKITLSGKLFLDPNRLVNVHARFSGEVVRLGTWSSETDPSGADRRLRFGDRVRKGQLLAVLWSKEVGDEKSDLVDAISRLRLDQKTLTKLREIETSGAVTERAVREAQRNFEADMIDATRAERTLRSWRFSEEEIAAIRAEAERLHANPESKNPDIERSWAEVNIVSPIDGVIIEHNSPVGDVVDASDVLFKVADLSRIGVVANLYEDDLPMLLKIKEEDRVMLVRVANDPAGEPMKVRVERMGDVVDPNQHTVALQGWIDNQDSRLRSGQFVTATIETPPPPGLLRVPASAVIDQGGTGVVYVSSSAATNEFERRVVAIARRSSEQVWIRGTPEPQELRMGAQPLASGDWVVSSGSLSLEGTLRDLQGREPAAPSAAPAGEPSAR